MRPRPRASATAARSSTGSLSHERGRRLRRAPAQRRAHRRAARFAPTSSCSSAPPTIRSPAAGPVAPGELGGRTWLLREPDSGTRSANEEFLSANALHGETLTVGSNGAIRQAARIGLGISFLSADAVTSDVEAGLLGVIAIDPAPPPRAWHVMRLAVGPARPLVDEFVAFVSASAGFERARPPRPGRSEMAPSLGGRRSGTSTRRPASAQQRRRSARAAGGSATRRRRGRRCRGRARRRPRRTPAPWRARPRGGSAPRRPPASTPRGDVVRPTARDRRRARRARRAATSSG